MKTHNTTGITLVEVLVVSAIFVIGLSAMLASAVSLFGHTAFSGDFLIASHLAAEGVEIVRNRRDANAVAVPSRAWNDGFDVASVSQAIVKPVFFNSNFTGNFVIDPVPYTLDDCINSNKSCQIYFDPALIDMYGDAGMKAVISGAVPTKFFRLITLAPVVCPASLEPDICTIGDLIGTTVTSTVRWRQGMSPKTASVSEALFNWIISP